MTQKSPLLVMIRPAAQSLQTLKVLQDRLGHKPNFVLNPLMMIESLDIDLPPNLSMPFIFTSQSAVTFTMQKTSQRGGVYCVGLKVSELAQKYGFNVIEVFETAEEMVNSGLPKGCTYLRGKHISVDFASYSDAQIKEYILYTQQPLPLIEATLQRMLSGCIIPVYSENLAIRLADCLDGELNNITVVCISNKVSKSLSYLNLGNVITVPKPTSEAMIDALVMNL